MSSLCAEKSCKEFLVEKDQLLMFVNACFQQNIQIAKMKYCCFCDTYSKNNAFFLSVEATGSMSCSGFLGRAAESGEGYFIRLSVSLVRFVQCCYRRFRPSRCFPTCAFFWHYVLDAVKRLCSPTAEFPSHNAQFGRSVYSRWPSAKNSSRTFLFKCFVLVWGCHSHAAPPLLWVDLSHFMTFSAI